MELTHQVRSADISIAFRSDEQIVEDGRECIKQRDRLQLRLGRLALEFAPMGAQGFRSGSYRRIDMYADRVGADAGTLRNYRNVAAAWQVVEIGESEFSWAILKALAPVGDKEQMVAILRSEKRPDAPDKPWTAEAALDVARERGLMPGKPTGRPPQGGEVGQVHSTVGTSMKRGSARRSSIAQREERRKERIATRREDTRASLLMLAGELASLSLVPDDREDMDPVLSQIEAEVARLRAELTPAVAS